MPSLRDGLFIIGVVVVFLFCLAWALPDDKHPHTTARSAAARKARAQGAHLAYVVGVMDLAAIVSVVAFRRGLVALGLPEVWSWVLTPVGLILVVVASVVATVDESSGAGWLLSLTVFLVLLFAYVAAAVGPSQFWHRLTTTPP